MLIAAAGLIAGFDGKFEFDKIGMDYLEDGVMVAPYIAMRMLPALLGVFLIPIAYITMVRANVRING
jgi:dolichyl-phosphate-mannose-protein mannosyltransferase